MTTKAQQSLINDVYKSYPIYCDDFVAYWDISTLQGGKGLVLWAFYLRRIFPFQLH